MFRYHVKYWDEDIKEPQEEKGLCGAEDYGHAAQRIADFYGKDNIVEMTLYETEDILTDSELSD